MPAKPLLHAIIHLYICSLARNTGSPVVPMTLQPTTSSDLEKIHACEISHAKESTCGANLMEKHVETTYEMK